MPRHLSWRAEDAKALWELAKACAKAAEDRPELTYGELAHKLDVTLESVCYAILRHWDVPTNGAVTVPITLKNEPNNA